MSNSTEPIRATRPTRNDVAKLAKMSGTTVSRVLSGKADESVSPKARERILQAARQLGYSPNSAAQALRSGRTGLVGFWMRLEYSRYRSQVMHQMRQELGASDLVLSVTDVDDDFTGTHSLARALRIPVDGIIAFDSSIAADAFAAEGEQLAPNLPFVSMGAFWTEARSYVGVDLREGARQATDHLLATGRKRIAYVAPRNTPFVVEGARYEGYRERMEAAGRVPISLAIAEPASERAGSLAEVLRECQIKGELPDALFCMFDDVAVDALESLAALGLVPGRDIAIVGFNGAEGLDRGACPISTVRQPIEKMCSLAFESLRTQMEDPTAPLMQVVLQPELVVRESSRR